MKSPDVIVVGGGVIGCAVAWELARRQVRTLLVDRALPGRATSASAGGLWPIGEAVGLGCGVIYHAARSQGESAQGESAQDAQASDPEPLPEVFRDFLHESNALFPALATELRERGGFDMEFETGAGLLFAIYNERERAFVERVARSLPREVRLDILDPDQVAEVEPQLTRDLIGGALLAGEFQVNPMAVAEAFKRAAILSKVRVKRVWAGLRPGTPDELPVLGPMDGLEGYVNATGGFRTGIVASPLTAQVVAATIYDPTSLLAARARPFSMQRFAAQ